MGSIETGDAEKAEKFYEDLADYAKSRGVSVNVISMEGTDCKLALLGKVADKSNGTINIVNPLKLGEKFKSILENRIVATNVKAKLIVNKYLYIRDEQLEAAELKAAENNNEKSKDELNRQKMNRQIPLCSSSQALSGWMGSDDEQPFPDLSCSIGFRSGLWLGHSKIF